MPRTSADGAAAVLASLLNLSNCWYNHVSKSVKICLNRICHLPVLCLVLPQPLLTFADVEISHGGWRGRSQIPNRGPPYQANASLPLSILSTCQGTLTTSSSTAAIPQLVLTSALATFARGTLLRRLEVTAGRTSATTMSSGLTVALRRVGTFLRLGRTVEDTTLTVSVSAISVAAMSTGAPLTHEQRSRKQHS